MNSSKTLLCIDDDLMILEIIQRFFEQHNFDVLTADNGEVGLELFKKNRPDIVIVDLKMPQVNGFQVLSEVTSSEPDTPIIVISGEGEMADVIQALHLGAWHYMTKPIENYDILEHAVQQALEKADLIQQNKAYQRGLERKLGSIVEHFPGFVFTCREDFVINYANDRLIEHVGKDLQGLKCFEEIFGQESVCEWCLGSMSYEGDVIRQEIHNPKDGHWYDMSLVPIVGREGEIVEHQVLLLDITEQKQKLQDAREREELLLEENKRLMDSLAESYRFGNIIGKSKAMQEVYRTILNAAGSDASVVIYGESGTGKELVAQSIHECSRRKQEPFITVNCGAIPENLIESEFFGYTKGAFSGANKDKHGYLSVADGGTLFLDEVGDIPLNMQVKLLRSIEGGGFAPLGSTEIKRPDVRIIAATNRDLPALVKEGAMRQDFLYRIHVIPIHLPPLRERKEDIRLLIDHFFEMYDSEGTRVLPSQIRKSLHSHPWPGNVRELQNTIHRFVSLGKLDFLELQPEEERQDKNMLDFELLGDRSSLSTMMENLERQVICNCFEEHNWHQSKTAAALQIDRKTLYRKMKQYGINRPD